MDLQQMQTILDYIEDNLKTDITVRELSDMAGFSLFHFYRLFQNATGMPVMQYVTRRRLLHALYDMHNGESMLSAALVYGFQTQAGFYKAFVREFGYTPTQFLRISRKHKPCRIRLTKEEHIVVSHKKIKEILRFWGLENEKLTDLVYEETGFVSESACYVGHEHVIKFTANLGAAQRHITLSQAIENAGLHTASPIKTLSGEWIAADGELYFYVTKRLKGRQVRAGKLYPDAYLPKARLIGEIIGQLDQALMNVDVLTDQANILRRAADWAIPTLKNSMELSDSFIEHYLKAFGEIYPTLPQQIIHRDLNPGNLILDGEGWGVLDFDLSERNIRIFDPCYAASAILSESFDISQSGKLQQWIRIYQNILYGYDAVVHLTRSEWQALPYVMVTNQLISTAWFSQQEKYAELYETNRQMTHWMLEHMSDLAFE